ncbi:MAG: NifB/NifX family molybdenum-iron cluster-binding protein, partial [Desulfobacteraceae bacterium]
NDYDNIESAFVHVEPDKNYVIKAIVPVHSKDGINSRIHGHFGRAPYFMVFTLNGKEIEVLNYYENEFLDQSEHIGLKVVRAISAYSADLLFAANVGEISFHMLKNNFVDIYKVNKEISVADAVHAYQNNELAPIFEPTHSIENSPVMKSN